MSWRVDETRKELERAIAERGEVIVFDVETTGLSAEKDRVIQISGIKFNVSTDNKLKEVGRLDEVINPERDIVPKITEITGYTNVFLRKYPVEADVFHKVYEFFGETPSVAAYNSKFDIKFLKQMYIRNNKPLKIAHDLDVLKMAKDLIPKKNVKNYKLGTIANNLYCDKGLTFHNAIDDTIATSRLLAIFIKKYEQLKEKEANAPVLDRKIANLISTEYWKGYRGFSRVYINTDLGSLYYDIRNKEWGAKDCDIRVINMEKLREDVFLGAGVSSEEELARVMRKS